MEMTDREKEDFLTEEIIGKQLTDGESKSLEAHLERMWKANVLKWMRLQNEWDMQTLANLMGVPHYKVKLMEQGIAVLELSEARKVIEIFKLQPNTEWVFEFVDEEYPANKKAKIKFDSKQVIQ